MTSHDQRPRPSPDSETSGPEGEPTGGGRTRRRWVPPEIKDLPKLNDLTLQTTVGDPIGGDEGVFP